MNNNMQDLILDVINNSNSAEDVINLLQQIRDHLYESQEHDTATDISVLIEDAEDIINSGDQYYLTIEENRSENSWNIYKPEQQFSFNDEYQQFHEDQYDDENNYKEYYSFEIIG